MQKRRKRLLALLLAGAMILNLGGFQIGATEVRAEETQETQEVTGSDENVEAENDNNVEEQKTQQVEEANQNAVQSEDVSENSENVKFFMLKHQKVSRYRGLMLDMLMILHHIQEPYSAQIMESGSRDGKE